MGDILRIKISRSVKILILLSLHEWNIFAFAPRGCTYKDGTASCDFQQWAPPLQDKDFGPSPLHRLSLNKIHGNILAGAFGGLNAPDTNKRTSINLICKPGNTRLSQDIFTPNLYWVMELKISHCKLLNGLPSLLLENLKSLQKLHIWRDVIDGLVAHDTLAGLTNLQEIAFRGSFRSGKLPSGFFDGLKSLTMIKIDVTNLNFIPPNWFNGLVSLEKIYLTLNNIQTLPKGLFDGLTALTYVNLANNPWNCSCELIWLLDWSHITTGGKCTDPLDMKNIELEDALGLLNCLKSTPAILSYTISSSTETSDTRTLSIPDFAVIASRTNGSSARPMLDQLCVTSTSGYALTEVSTLNKQKTSTCSFSESFAIQAISSPASSIPMIMTATSTTKTPTATSTASRKVSPAIEIRKTAFMPTFYSTRTSIRKGTWNGSYGFLNDTSNIALMSTIGTLTIVLIGAVMLFRYKGRNNCIDRVNRINNSDEERDGSNS